MLTKILRVVKNFYFATGVGLLTWMLFFDANDIISQIRNSLKLGDLETDLVYYDEKIKEVEIQRQSILGNPRLQEKYARENYLMKKPNEDVYVLVNEKNEPIEK
ncbi:FtsB family cell division protein [Larkinella punicea]|uniref:Septum formation initiator family protein n=1 Tax=Larkinella punicea TaxID=2315727 RepID=A0A368JNW0_9BACT|nr:septum formation initiator family protein [Larkinella punicea]RCR69182.1 septum formation initiator family protein [Larkinella punicea]